MGGSRILFLGTGGDAFVIGKQYRSSGGIIFNYEKHQFHIDPGPSALLMAKMAQVNLRETSGLFISSNDIFRANDANAVISAMTHDGLDKRGILVCPSSVVVDEDRQKGPFVNKFYKRLLEKTITIDNTNKLAIDDLEIEIVNLKEHLSLACGFKFITPRFNLTYIPNTSFSNEILDSIDQTDILILNIRDPRESEKKDFLNGKHAEQIIKKIKPQLVIITGFGIKMLQSDPLYESREIQKNTGVQVIAAKDGMSINPTSFAATVRQKSLKGF